MILFGHRGAKGEAPENTLTGFAYACAMGLFNFEFDVRLTADHEIAVLHDVTVDRTTNTQDNKALSDLTYAQAAALEARSSFPDWPHPCFIPTLAQVLAEIPAEGRLEVEIKRDDPERLEILAAALVPLLRSCGAANRTTIVSFDINALRIMQRIAPELPRGYIGAYDTPEFLETALTLECLQASIPLKTGSRERVEEAHQKGLRVVGWLGNSREDLQTLLDWGVDGITTDYPGIALPFLRERNLLDRPSAAFPKI